MTTFYTFKTAQEAWDYRAKHGTGGWIFVPDDGSVESVLFPVGMSPTEIMTHRFTVRLNGRLV